MGYDLETSGCVLSASNFTEEMNACFWFDKDRILCWKNKENLICLE